MANNMERLKKYEGRVLTTFTHEWNARIVPPPPPAAPAHTRVAHYLTHSLLRGLVVTSSCCCCVNAVAGQRHPPRGGVAPRRERRGARARDPNVGQAHGARPQAFGGPRVGVAAGAKREQALHAGPDQPREARGARRHARAGPGLGRGAARASAGGDRNTRGVARSSCAGGRSLCKIIVMLLDSLLRVAVLHIRVRSCVSRDLFLFTYTFSVFRY